MNSDDTGFSQGTEHFSEVLNYYPPKFEGNRLNLILLEDAHPIFDPEQLIRSIDSPLLIPEKREYILDESSWVFPVCKLLNRPDPKVLSEKLFHNYDQAKRVLLTQDE